MASGRAKEKEAWDGDGQCAIKVGNKVGAFPVETFSIRYLRERTGELVREAEAGHLSIFAKHGRPLFIAVPMDEHLLKEGVAVALAVRLFAEKSISLGKAAKLAQLSVEDFIGRLGVMGVPAVDYPLDELDEEAASWKRWSFPKPSTPNAREIPDCLEPKRFAPQWTPGVFVSNLTPQAPTKTPASRGRDWMRANWPPSVSLGAALPRAHGRAPRTAGGAAAWADGDRQREASYRRQAARPDAGRGSDPRSVAAVGLLPVSCPRRGGATTRRRSLSDCYTESSGLQRLAYSTKPSNGRGADIGRCASSALASAMRLGVGGGCPLRRGS